MTTHTTHSRTRLARAVLALITAATLLVGISAGPSAGSSGDTQSGVAFEPSLSEFDEPLGTASGAAAAGAEAEAEATAGAVADTYLPNAAGLADVPGEAVATPDVERFGDAPVVVDLGLPAEGVAGDIDEVSAAIAADGSAPLVVTLRTPMLVAGAEAAANNAEALEANAARITADVDSVVASLAGTASVEVSRVPGIAAFAADVDAAGLDRLLSSPLVAHVMVDAEGTLALDVSTARIDSDLLNQAGVRGDNFNGSGEPAYEVAVLDTGVDGGHSAFAGRIVREACFSSGNWCPNGNNTQIGGNAGEDCNWSAQCDHGTHVAGIAAGGSYGGGGHEGVARGARTIAVHNGHRSPSRRPGETNPRCRYRNSTLNLGLAHVRDLANAGRNVASVNLSIGGALYGTAASCDAGNPSTRALVAQLVALDVAVVAAAGNDGSSTQMSHPACLSNVYSVGAVNDFDTPAGFTNSDTSMNWWAPGVSINAPVPTGTSRGSKSGTSMASPHVAGAFALLRECIPNNSPSSVAADLTATGVWVTRNGVTKRRINVLDAATRNVNNNDFGAPETLSGASGSDFDWNVCGDRQSGEVLANGAAAENSIWWRWTPPSTGTATITTNDGSFNTTFNTQLSVFTSNSAIATFGTLIPLAYDNDGGVGTRSRVVVPVSAGRTYYIQVDGFAGSNGEVNLTWDLGPAPTCRGRAATIIGTPANDVIWGTTGDDVIIAGDGNDSVRSRGGNDTICLGNGNDYAFGDTGNDTIDGEAGNDTILGGDGNDRIYGHLGNDRLYGQAGNDTILGNQGAAINDGADADDRIDGGDGNDLLDGWDGDDLILPGEGDDRIYGAAGMDQITYNNVAGPINGNLDTGVITGAGNDTESGVENLRGTIRADVLVGDDGPNQIWGGSSPDDIFGGLGNDLLFGQAGTDTIRGAGGLDKVYGGGGNDTLFGGPDKDRIYGQSGVDKINAGTGDDFIDGGTGAPDNCDGAAGNDKSKKCEVNVNVETIIP